MDITEHIEKVEKIVSEKHTSFEYTTEQINELFERLLKEVAPRDEVKAAQTFVDVWIYEFRSDYEKKFKLLDEHLDYANYAIENAKGNNEITDDFLEHAQGFLKEILELGFEGVGKNPEKADEILKKYDPKKIRLPIEMDETKKPKEPIEKAYDFDNINRLVKQSPFVFRLEHFIKKANKTLSNSRFSFNILHWILKLRRAILVVFGILITIYIDDLFGEQLKEFIKSQFALDIKPIWLSILSSLFCIFTLERLLERIKDKTFWNYADDATKKTRNTYNEFCELKAEFTTIVETYSTDK